jgi:hypothetical protein
MFVHSYSIVQNLNLVQADMGPVRVEIVKTRRINNRGLNGTLILPTNDTWTTALLVSFRKPNSGQREKRRHLMLEKERLMLAAKPALPLILRRRRDTSLKPSLTDSHCEYTWLQVDTAIKKADKHGYVVIVFLRYGTSFGGN